MYLSPQRCEVLRSLRSLGLSKDLKDTQRPPCCFPDARRPLALARKVTTRFLLLVLVEPSSLAALTVPSKAAVVGVRNDVLLRLCFGPEAAGGAAPAFVLVA